MNRKFIVVPILIIIAIVGLTFGSEKENKIIFHVTLADPNLYKNGIYSNSFIIDKGDYLFKFIPNGDSPQSLIINLKGKDYNFSENFKLVGSLHQTGISEYYTWDYDGEKGISIPSLQEVQIEINPNGNLLGTLTVDIIKN